MIPRVNPRRDELAAIKAQPASFLSPKFMTNAEDILRLFRGMENEGATKREIFDETHKLVPDPKNETGLFRGADSKIRTEISDENMRIRPGVESYFHPTEGGETPIMPAGKFIKHDQLFQRQPDLMDVQTKFVMPEESAGPYMGQGSYWDRDTGAEGGTGYALAQANADVRDPNSRMPFSLLNVMSHELGGHAVQDYNRFAKGGHPDSPVMRQAHEDLVHPRAVKYRDTITDFKNSTGLSDEEWMDQFPEADQYLMASGTLAGRRARAGPQFSTLPNQQRYENLAGEQEANMVVNRLGMSGEERQFDAPWMSNYGDQNPYELQMLRTGPIDYSMMDDKGTLARILQKRPLR